MSTLDSEVRSILAVVHLSVHEKASLICQVVHRSLMQQPMQGTGASLLGASSPNLQALAALNSVSRNVPIPPDILLIVQQSLLATTNNAYPPPVYQQPPFINQQLQFVAPHPQGLVVNLPSSIPRSFPTPTLYHPFPAMPPMPMQQGVMVNTSTAAANGGIVLNGQLLPYFPPNLAPAPLGHTNAPFINQQGQDLRNVLDNHQHGTSANQDNGTNQRDRSSSRPPIDEVTTGTAGSISSTVGASSTSNRSSNRSRNQYEKVSDNEYATLSLCMAARDQEVPPCPAGGHWVFLPGGDNRGRRVTKRFGCSHDLCTVIIRWCYGVGLPDPERHEYRWERLVGNEYYHHTPPPLPTVTQLVEAMDQAVATVGGIPSAIYDRLKLQFSGHYIPQLESLTTFRRFMLAQDYNRRMAADPAVVGNPINFAAGLQEYSQARSIFTRIQDRNLLPSSQYRSPEDIATALGCANLYTELTIPVEDSDLQSITGLTAEQRLHARTSIIVTCPAHLWSLHGFLTLYQNPEYRACLADGTGLIIAGQAVIISLAGIDIDVDANRGRTTVRRSARIFAHNITVTEKLVAAYVLVAGVARVVSAFFGIAFDPRQLTSDYSQSIRGGTQLALPNICLSLCYIHISRAPRENPHWTNVIANRGYIDLIQYYLHYLHSCRTLFQFVRSYLVFRQVLTNLSEIRFVALLDRKYGPSSPCLGMWFYSCLGKPLLLPENQPFEAYYREVKGSTRLGIPPLIRMNRPIGAFLQFELPKLLRHDSLNHSGVGMNTSGAMHTRNPYFVDLAMASLLNFEVDVRQFIGHTGSTEYCVNGKEFMGQPWTTSRLDLYLQDLTGFREQPNSPPEFSQFVIDLFKNRNVDAGHTLSGVLKGTTAFVSGICHVIELPNDFPAYDGSRLICLCIRFWKKCGCAGQLFIKCYLQRHRPGMTLEQMQQQIYVSRSAASAGRSRTTNSRHRRRRRQSEPFMRNRRRMHDTSFHDYFGIEGAPICSAFQFLCSLTTTQLHEVLIERGKRVPTLQTGRHYPRQNLLVDIISGTALGDELKRLATTTPGRHPNWIALHDAEREIQEARNRSYLRENGAAPAPHPAADDEDGNPHAPSLAAMRLQAEQGTTPTSYVIGTHERAFSHLLGASYITSTYLAIEFIVDSSTYSLLNDESLSSAVNYGSRDVVGHFQRDDQGTSRTDRRSVLTSILGATYQRGDSGLVQEDEDDFVLEPFHMDLLIGRDDAIALLIDTISEAMEDSPDTVGRSMSATFSVATRQLVLLRYPTLPPYQYHSIDLTPSRYQYRSEERHNQHISGGTRVVCCDKEQLAEHLYSYWAAYHGNDIEADSRRPPDMNVLDLSTLESDPGVVVLQCFCGRYPTANTPQRPSHEVCLGVSLDLVWETTNEADDESEGPNNNTETTGRRTRAAGDASQHHGGGSSVRRMSAAVAAPLAAAPLAAAPQGQEEARAPSDEEQEEGVGAAPSPVNPPPPPVEDDDDPLPAVDEESLPPLPADDDDDDVEPPQRRPNENGGDEGREEHDAWTDAWTDASSLEDTYDDTNNLYRPWNQFDRLEGTDEHTLATALTTMIENAHEHRHEEERSLFSLVEQVLNENNIQGHVLPSRQMDPVEPVWFNTEPLKVSDLQSLDIGNLISVRIVSAFLSVLATDQRNQNPPRTFFFPWRFGSSLLHGGDRGSYLIDSRRQDLNDQRMYEIFLQDYDFEALRMEFIRPPTGPAVGFDPINILDTPRLFIPIYDMGRDWISIVVDTSKREILLYDGSHRSASSFQRTRRQEQHYLMRQWLYLRAVRKFVTDLEATSTNAVANELAEWAVCVGVLGNRRHRFYEEHRKGSLLCYIAFRTLQSPAIDVSTLFSTRYMGELGMGQDAQRLLVAWILISVMQNSLWDGVRVYGHEVVLVNQEDDTLECPYCLERHDPQEHDMVEHGDGNDEGMCGLPMCLQCWMGWPYSGCPHCNGEEGFRMVGSGELVVHRLVQLREERERELEARRRLRERQQRRRQIQLAPRVVNDECGLCAESMAGRRSVEHAQCGYTLCFDCHEMNNQSIAYDDGHSPLVAVGRCPHCRTATQWTDTATGQEIPIRVYGYRRMRTSDGDQVLVSIDTVREWNQVCRSLRRYEMMIDYTDGAVFNVDM